MSVTRRQFLSAALVGLSRKAGRTIGGSFVNESAALGHRLRDGAAFPVPRTTARIPILVVGGGIAGLSAGWQLQRRGFSDFVILEMADRAGGNARWGENEVSSYPWAAHYVPVPGAGAGLVRELFAELGLVDPAGAWDERHLCHAPQERLFLHGRWEEGLEPQIGPTRHDRDQFRRFDDLVRTLRASGEFTIPMARGARDRSLDSTSMQAWMAAQGFDSPWLRWQIDYACRDDYGARPHAVSAWAGLHYFAAREEDDPGPLTWPEGNGWIVKRLLQRLGDRVRTNTIVFRIARRGTRWTVATPDTLWHADAVIFAAPTFLASRVIDGGLAAGDFEYSPWLTANLTLDRWPQERGFPVAWDNVIFDSPGLGYVVATHQTMRTYVPRTVWTYYWALVDDSPQASRRWLLAQTYPTLRDHVLADLARAHPDIADCVVRIDIMRHGHAMIRPTVGFLSSSARRQAIAARDRLFYANSDLSGLSLFEEAQYRGVTAAEQALLALRT